MNITLEQKVIERTHELQEVNVSLEEQQEEINSQKEELSAQKESLEETNEVLRTTQEEIITQNKELDLHRNKLEYLVESRTAELKEALKKAEESDKLKSSFLANMSHEIRTPMNAIIGFSSLLRDDTFDESLKNKYLNMIINNSESLLVLINDILDLSKIQSNQLTFNNEWYELKLIFTELYSVFQLDEKSKENELILDIQKIKDNSLIFTDVVRLKQVISNLLSNAIKFTPTGIIEFGIYDVSDEITFYVKDNGIGIPENVGDSIFKRFYKLEEDKENLYRGAGLGLAISKSLVDLWGGKLWYKSKEKKGTIFYFTHPLKQNSSIATLETNKEITILPDLHDKTILIVEDEDSNYYLLKAYLHNTEVNILWAKNGKEACKMVETHSIDLILMDIKMPELNGKKAAMLIKQKRPDLPIIAQTAYNQTKIESPDKGILFNSVVSKPISRRELFSAISRVI
jgi:signal transduction histidine kinase